MRASADNRHAVDESVLAALGPEGHIVNIARGSVIDQQALVTALTLAVILARFAIARFFFGEAVESGGWLIFYGHDVANAPSPYGCTPYLMRHALQAAGKRDMPIVTVAEALRRIGA